MKDYGLGIYVVLMAILGAIAVKFLGAAIDIIVAMLGVVGSLLVSVFKYSADRLRDQENEKLKIKRANYQKLLEAIGLFAVDTEKGHHRLTVVHTESWAFASDDVVVYTNKFLETPSQQTLQNVLEAMRKDVDLPKLVNAEDLAKNLYPEKKSGFASVKSI